MTKAKTAISILALGAGLSLAGCANWPDSLNPGSWFGSGDADNTVAGGERDYPSLSSVPERPAPRDEEAEKKAEDQLKADRAAGRAVMPPALGDGLAADRADARYIDEPLRREKPHPAAPPPPPAEPEPEPEPAQATAAAAPSAAPPPAVKSEPVPAPRRAAAPSGATPPQQMAAPPAVPPPPASIPAAPEIVAMAPVRSPGDPPPPGAAALPSASLTWNAPPPDIDLVRTSGPRGRETPITMLRGNGGGPVARVMFALGSAKLDPNDEARLRQVAEAYRRAGGTVAVVGHASATAADRTNVRRQIANFSVSMDRASAVAQALQRYGVPGQAIAISAQTDAVALNDADGRRADVFLR